MERRKKEKKKEHKSTACPALHSMNKTKHTIINRVETIIRFAIAPVRKVREIYCNTHVFAAPGWHLVVFFFVFVVFFSCTMKISFRLKNTNRPTKVLFAKCKFHVHIQNEYRINLCFCFSSTSIVKIRHFFPASYRRACIEYRYSTRTNGKKQNATRTSNERSSFIGCKCKYW